MAAQGVPSFLYQFSHYLDFVGWSTICGDYHSSEIAFVLRNQWPPVLHTFDAADWTVSDAMSGYWTNFAMTHNPNTGPTPVGVQWPQYDETSDYNAQLQVPLNVTQYLLQPLCDMWDGIANVLGHAEPAKVARLWARGRHV